MGKEFDIILNLFCILEIKYGGVYFSICMGEFVFKKIKNILLLDNKDFYNVFDYWLMVFVLMFFYCFYNEVVSLWKKDKFLFC